MIKEYLKLAKTLETLLYEQGNVICNMKNEIVWLQNYKYEETESHKSTAWIGCGPGCQWIFWAGIAGAVIGLCANNPWGGIYWGWYRFVDHSSNQFT